MKLTLLCFIAMLTCGVASGQTVNGTPVKDIDVEYVEIVGTSKFLTTKVFIEIDFGQETKFFSRDTIIKDANGKLVTFNSMIDALNFMTTNGYDFVQAYIVTTGNQNVYHYLLRKHR